MSGRTKEAEQKAIEIGTAVQRRMDALGINQVALAERAGVSQSTISKIISGDNVYLLTVVRVVDALGTTLSRLLSGPPLPDRAIEAAETYATLDEAQQQAVDVHMKSYRPAAPSRPAPVSRARGGGARKGRKAK